MFNQPLVGPLHRWALRPPPPGVSLPTGFQVASVHSIEVSAMSTSLLGIES